MIAVTGYRSNIIKELSKYDDVVRIDDPDIDGNYVIPCADRFVLCADVIYDKCVLDQTPEETVTSILINGFGPIRLCETILSEIDDCSICVVGSDAGINGSFDMSYACAKAAIHLYVKKKWLKPLQHLCCVASTEHTKDEPLLMAKHVAGCIWEQLRHGKSNSILSIAAGH